MLALISTLCSWLACRILRRTELELELIALRHQVAVLNRQRPGRLRLCSVDRLVWVWPYRVWPRCLETMVLVKPATVVQWHRQGFRLYWRWRSQSGRRPIAGETRKLIREMCIANPLWGAPRIHGELLKLGITLSQATVAKYMLLRPHSPSPSWRSFLRNQALGIVAIDMFIVPSATFRLFRNAHTGPRPPQDCPLRCHTASDRGLAVASGDRSVPLGPLLAFCCAIETLLMARYSASGSKRCGSPRS